MVCNYDFTVAAENDVDEILSYLSIELANPFAAKIFYIELNKTIDTICSFPKSGALVQNDYISDSDIRKLPISNYLLYYRYKEPDNILVIRIIFGKRDPNQTSKELNNY